MDLHGGVIVARFLAERQVACLFTLCGGHISPILVAAKAAGIRIVDMRHEANAVFAADAVSRLTGRPGVAAVTAGPGVTNTITALKNAAMAQSPVILIGGAAPTVLKGRGALQDIDQMSLLRPVVKQALTIKRNCDILPVLESAFQTATSGVPGPVFVECPIDLLYPESMVREWYGGQKQDTPPPTLRERLLKAYLGRHVDRMFACSFETMEAGPWSPTETAIDAALITKAADILRQSRQPVAIVGSQALLQAAQAPALARALAQIGLPVYLTGMARGLMGCDHPLVMRHQRRKALKAADTVLIAGMPCDFRLDYGRAIARQATLIGVNRSRRDLRLNRTPQLAVAADPGRFLAALAEEGTFPQERWTPWIDRLRKREAEREAAIQAQADEAVDGINPLHFLKTLDAFLDDSALLVADGGDFVASAAYTLRPRGPLSWLDPGVFGTLGVGAGFAAGAKLCRPDAEVWLIYGDGSAGYTLAEFDTLVRHKLPVIAVVGNDAGWSQIARDQVTYLQDDVATVLAPTAYDQVVEGLGAKGIRIARPEEIVPALEDARRTAAGGRPVLINVHIGRTGFRDGSISM
ncbi:MAG: thiamine pyrophosphate-binding protein [Desulfobacteraceae bacterium]|nr:thiamine pyrophosphate-binding protein [Desulfobacteraceae bacterium]MBC2750892.1 thiamine pyrophosphate-binding protein [Desulfobacteraceae bacterium]